MSRFGISQANLVACIVTCLTVGAADLGRTREQFLATLRAHYETRKDAEGHAWRVVDDPRSGAILIQRGNRTSRYSSLCLAPGDVAPELTCAGWLNTAGGPPATKGKVLWVEFSATWCGPCMQSMPRVQALYAKLKDRGLEVVVVTDETAKVFAPYLKSHGYTMPAACGTERALIERGFGVTGWPTAILVGRDGKVAYVGDPRDEEIEGALEELLSAGAAVPTDLAALRRAAEAGDAKAQFALSERYRKADGVETDQRAQLEWLTSAAKQGLPEAERTLANLYGELGFGNGVPNAIKLYAEWMAKAASHGDLDAKLEMASLLHDGWDKAGVRQDKAAALALWREAAALGSVNGEIQVGRCYENGDAVERDRAQAATWYRKAIERDPVLGYSFLGRMLAKSDREADRIEAVACLRFSSDEHKEDWLKAMEAEEKLSPEARERALQRTREIKAEVAARPQSSK